MSQDNSCYGINREVITLKKERYWYQLKFLPIFDSLKIKFSCDPNSVTLNRFRDDWIYSYDTLDDEFYDSTNEEYILKPEFKIVNIVSSGSTIYVDNDITYIPITSQESQEYAKVLIGTTRIVGTSLLNITEDNYRNYVNFIVNKTFLDFRLSEKITKEVIDSIDENGNLNFPNMEVVYFHQLF